MALPVERDNAKLSAKLTSEQRSFLEGMLQRTDPLADAVIEELHAVGPQANQALQQGLNHGLASVANPPPAIAALLQQVETLPAWVEPDILRRGSSAYLSIEPLWNDISLSIGSLVHIYASPAIARVLSGTKGLLDAETAGHRLIETAVWAYSSMLPNGLTPGSRGFIATIQVRLLHARVRLMYLKRDWDVATWGVPINQVDLARTWLDFTYVPYRALAKFGFDFTEPELRDAYHLWQYMGHLLGIDPIFYRDVAKHTDICDHAGAEKLLDLLEVTNREPDENSRKLIATMMTVMTEQIMASLKTPFALTGDISNAMLRFIHGDALADSLGIGRTELTNLLPMLAFANQTARQMQRAIPSVWDQLARKAVEKYAKIVEENSATAEYRERLKAQPA